MRKKLTVLCIILAIIAFYATAQRSFLLPNNKSEHWQLDTVHAFAFRWFPFELRIIFNYNPQGLLDNLFYEIEENNIWSNYELTNYAYDSNGNQLSELTYKWNNDSWVLFQQYFCTYDSNDNLLTESNRDVGMPPTTIYTYDSNHNLVTTTLQKWNVENNDWKNLHRWVVNYDINNNKLSEIFQGWRPGSNEWGNREGYMINYDQNNNGITAERVIWDETSWQLDYYLFLNAYLCDLPLYYNHMQDVYWFHCYYKVTASYKVKEVNNENGIKDVTEGEHPTIVLSPNPTAGQLYITNDDQPIQLISIYSMSGALLFTTRETHIDLSELTAGIYFVCITTNNGIVTKKVVKM